LLFNLRDDPGETRNAASTAAGTLDALRAETIRVLAGQTLAAPALEEGVLRALPFEPFPRVRIKQFARGITDFGQGPLPA
jgi:hypothetical protein